MSKLNEFEEQVFDWLSTPASERDLELGAKLLLQISKNKILHRNVIRQSNFNKIEFVLSTYLGDKAKDIVVETKEVDKQTVVFEKKFNEITDKIEGKGKREDHDQLPEFIQAIPEANTGIYQKMRSLQERLKILSSGTSTMADRLPFITELMELDRTLVANWETYDTFDLSKYVTKPSGVALDIKQIQAARTYLSRAAAKKELTEKALEETQNRYNDLILDGQTVTPEITDKLKALGVIVMEVKDTEEIPPVVEDLPAGGNTEVTPAAAVTETPNTDSSAENIETPEENVISQIKTLLKNDIEKEIVISTIVSLGKFGELELTPEIVEDLYNKAVSQEIEEEVE